MTKAKKTEANKNHDVIAIGGGVAGIYQIKKLIDNGFDAVMLEANEDLGGTWFKNRYPGCRFDSESYSYGYSFSRELIDEWHWKEHFSPQPENLKYLNYVVEKFDLRQHLTARFIVTCVGVLSAPFFPPIDGIDNFKGRSFHSFDWPTETLDLSNSKVGIIGTGATAIQIIAEIADKVGELNVFQRHANWSIPLNNGPISQDEMNAIRAGYDKILATCDKSQGGFVHLPDRRGFDAVTEAERKELWDDLYDRRGFALLLANFPETFLEDGPNTALSNYVADRIRQRVKDPAVAEKLIPTDHGFGMKRLPLETNYFEAYNRDNVHLIDITETPIKTVTPQGIQTADQHHDLDVIIYATGFDAITGGLNKIDIQGTSGTLKDKWQSQTTTYLGLLNRGFPNMLMVAGPQSVSGSTNYPRSIETGVEWVTDLLLHARESDFTRLEVKEDAENWWCDIVTTAQERMPFSKIRSWFTGFAPNINGAKQKSEETIRYNAYWGGAPKYRGYLEEVKKDQYSTLTMD